MPSKSLLSSYPSIVDKILTYRLYSKLMASLESALGRNGTATKAPDKVDQDLDKIKLVLPPSTGQPYYIYHITLNAEDFPGIKFGRNFFGRDIRTRIPFTEEQQIHVVG